MHFKAKQQYTGLAAIFQLKTLVHPDVFFFHLALGFDYEHWLPMDSMKQKKNILIFS